MSNRLAKIWEEAIEVSIPFDVEEEAYPEIPEFEQDFCSFCEAHPGATHRG